MNTCSNYYLLRDNTLFNWINEHLQPTKKTNNRSTKLILFELTKVREKPTVMLHTVYYLAILTHGEDRNLKKRYN
jgi:hypothetical protein